MLADAEKLVTQGFPVFPVKYRAKKPPLTIHGFKDASISFNQLKEWDEKHGQYNIGIRTGNGFCVVDIDPRKGGSETWADLLLNNNLPDTVSAITGGGGRHFFFAINKEMGCKTDFLPGIDFKADGGYVMAPGSIHPDTGKKYEWFPDYSPDELDFAPLPDWINHEKVGKFAKNNDLDKGFVAAEHLKKDNLLPAAPGERNDSCARLAGELIQDGLKLEKVIRLCIMWNRGNKNPLPQSEIETTVKSIYNTDRNNHPEKTEPDSELPPQKLIQSEIIKPNITSKQIKVGGIIQEMCEWMDKCAYRKQPILSFANAIAFFASVIGRNYKLEDDTRSNLYVLGISGTGSGKDNSRKRIATLASEAKLNFLFAGEDVTSGAAILSALNKTSKKTVFFPFDEMGAFLSNKTGRNSSSHQAEIPALLTKLYTSSNSIHFGKKYANEKINPCIEINQPHVNLYGTSNPGDLFKAITEQMISSGLMGRMLCFFPISEHPKASRNSKNIDPPISLIRDLNTWANYFIQPPWDRGDIEGIVNHYPNIIKISDKAKDVFFEYDEIFFKKGKKYKFNKNLDALWVRGCEQAKKLALVFTCSLARVPGDMPPVSAQMAEDCCQMIKTLVERICIECDQNVIGSDFEALQKKIMDAIRMAGDTGATASNIFAMTRAWKTIEKNNAVQALIDFGFILMEKNKIQGSRKSTNFFFIRKQ